MYQKTQLENGIRVVTESLPYIHSVSVGVWINAGSRQEENHLSGTAHFAEHMLFKCTHKRSAKEIAEEIEAVGGQLKAFTNREYTGYYARVMDVNFPLTCEVLSDIILESH